MLKLTLGLDCLDYLKEIQHWKVFELVFKGLK